MRAWLLLVLLLVASASAQVDQDGDGFFTSNQFATLVDCCDSITQCPNPYLVNPGAAEILGNGIDDNCDGVVDGIESCSVIGSPTVIPQLTFTTATQTAMIMPAIDIYSCSAGQDAYWGYQSLYEVALQLANGNPRGVSGPFQAQFSIQNYFGEIGPVKGPTFFVMSTGQALNPSQAVQPATLGNTSFGSSPVTPPAVWLAANGGVIPLSPSCTKKRGDEEDGGKSKRDLFYGYYYNNQAYTYTYNVPYSNAYTSASTTSNVYDSARVRFTLRQPTNFNAFAFKVKFGSSAKDMPVNKPCAHHNDYFLILKETAAVAGTLPPDQNIAKTAVGTNFQSLDESASFFTQCKPATTQPQACSQGNFRLLNSPLTGATDWIYTGASAQPAELFNVSFVLWDTGNSYVDTTVMIDAFTPVAEAKTTNVGTITYGYITTGDIEMVTALPAQRYYSQAANPGGIIVTYTLQIRNNGPQSISDIYVSYTPAMNTTHLTATGLTCTPTSTTAPYALQRCKSTVYTNSNQLASGASFTVTIKVLVSRTFIGQVMNSFWASCSSVNLDASNDFAYAPVTIVV